MSSLYNRARVNTATVGTGTMTLGAAVSGAFFTFAEAGVPDGTVVSYVIEDGSNVEMGIGTYTVSGTTLSRTTVTASKIGGTAGTTKLTLSGSAVVFIDALAADITTPPASSTDKGIPTYNGTTGRAIQDNPAWTIGVSGNLTGTLNSNADFTTLYWNSSTGASARTVMSFAAGDLTQAGMSFIANHSIGQNTVASDHGDLVIGTNTANILYFIVNAGVAGEVNSSGNWGFGGAFTPLTKLEIRQDSAATNTVTKLLTISSTSSGTPANGIGAGMQFNVETAAGVEKIGATAEGYAWDVTPGSEDFAVVFRTMSAGATASEEGRVGFMPISLVQNDNINIRAAYGMVVPEAYEIAAGVTLELGAGAIMEITA